MTIVLTGVASDSDTHGALVGMVTGFVAKMG